MNEEPTRATAPSSDTLLGVYATMVRIRAFEERVQELFLAGRIPGFAHLYLGQEAVAAGVCAALRRDDYITSTHRGHGHALAKGAAADRMMAELMGKATGTCGGKGGSMHVADFAVGMLGANGIVGGGLGIAAGAAFSARYRATRPAEAGTSVAVAFFGDGAANKGTFHEALNFSAVRRLPAIFVCENNAYAQFTDPRYTLSVADVADRAAGYGIPGAVVDGNDAVAVYQAATAAVERARRGEGPSLLEMKTYRFGGHYVGDPERYRSRDEVAERRRRDPIPRLAERLLADGTATPAALEAVARDAAAEIDAAVAFALASPDPAPEEALTDVVAPSPEHPERPAGPAREMTFGEATRDVMRAAMRADPRVVVMGEDIHWGGNFGQFVGLYDEFGPERVVDMPISESVIVAAALGAAITGLRPIISMSFVDFTLGAMDELINQVAKIRYMFGGQVDVPLVFRASDGVVRQTGAQHSQSLESVFAHVPGLYVVAPSTVADAKGLLAAAIAGENPVLYLEHKALGGSTGPAPEGDHVVPLGRAALRRPGRDATVVTYSLMTRTCLAVAETLAAEGIELEVIDLRSIAPLDFATIAASVRRTGRALVAHEAWRQGGFGAEVASRIAEELFDYLDAPVARVGARHAPMPFSPALEKLVLPGAADVERAVRALLEGHVPGASRPTPRAAIGASADTPPPPVAAPASAVAPAAPDSPSAAASDAPIQPTRPPAAVAPAAGIAASPARAPTPPDSPPGVTVVVMPTLGLTMETGTIARWYKRPGDPVRKGEPLLAVQNEKATVDVDAPASGTLRRILASEGETLPVTTPIAEMA